MSCKMCDEFQQSDMTSFFRWKNANIEIRACAAHMTEVFEVLRDYQKKEDKEKKTI